MRSPNPYTLGTFASQTTHTQPNHALLTAFWGLAWLSLQGTALLLHPITLHVAQQIEEAFLVR